MIEAKVICDSISPQSHRLTTFKLRYPRFIHAEFMTHRMLSRNASSSRATPVTKNIEEVRSVLRAEPVFWGAEQKGMQAGAELTGDALSTAQWRWEMAAKAAADQAEWLAHGGVHKSIINRVLEPFLHINVIATATEWMNFFGLRLDRAAEPTMRALAEAMWKAYSERKPCDMAPGDWHLPFATSDDWSACDRNLKHLIKVSVARCARVSYESFETGRRSTVEEDLRLYDKLVGVRPIHASPAEHQATPDEFMPETYTIETPAELTEEQRAKREMPVGITLNGYWAHHEQHGNLTGWRQYRKMLPEEAIAPLPKEYRR